MITAAPAGAALHMRGAVARGSFRLDAALQVAPGEILAILGPNGAGKTTLLRALSGLDPLTTGSIRLGDDVLDDVATATFVPPERRRVAHVFQSYRLFPHLDVCDNVAFAPRAGGAGRGESRRIAQSWLDRFELGPLSGRRPHQISGGQAQRVALARALAAKPRLLLLDEPLSALDARARLDVRTQLRTHLTHFAGPVIIVTHDAIEAMVMADRLVVLEDGRVVQDGSPAEVARRPATQYVARLVGLNLYPGRLDSAAHLVSLDGGGVLTVTLDDDWRPTAAAPGARVLVALRPAAITLHTSAPDHTSSRNNWTGTVAGLEALADRVRVQVDGQPPALVDVSAAAVAELQLRPGSNVWLSAKATETAAYADPDGSIPFGRPGG